MPIDEFVGELTDSTVWEIEVHEKRPRPVEDGAPRVDDIVLRARRHSG